MKIERVLRRDFQLFVFILVIVNSRSTLFPLCISQYRPLTCSNWPYTIIAPTCFSPILMFAQYIYYLGIKTYFWTCILKTSRRFWSGDICLYWICICEIYTSCNVLRSHELRFQELYSHKLCFHNCILM